MTSVIAFVPLVGVLSLTRVPNKQRLSTIGAGLLFVLPFLAVVQASGFSLQRRLGEAEISAGSSFLTVAAMLYSAAYIAHSMTVSRTSRGNGLMRLSLILLLAVSILPVFAAAVNGRTPNTSFAFPLLSVIAVYTLSVRRPLMALMLATWTASLAVWVSFFVLVLSPAAAGWGVSRGFDVTPVAAMLAGQRYAGVTEHPNSMGYLSAICCALVWGQRRRLPKAVVFATLAVALVGLLSSESRSALLGVALAVLVSFAWRVAAMGSRRYLPLRATLSAVVLGASSALLLGTTNILSDADTEVAGRTIVWAFVREEWMSSPWIGHGADGLAIHVAAGDLPAFAGQAHNQWLDSLFKGGLVALGALIALALVLLIGALRVAVAGSSQLLMLFCIVMARFAYESPLSAAGSSWAVVSTLLVFGTFWPLLRGLHARTSGVGGAVRDDAQHDAPFPSPEEIPWSRMREERV